MNKRIALIPLGFSLDFIMRALPIILKDNVDKIVFIYPKSNEENRIIKDNIKLLRDFYLSKIIGEELVDFVPVNISDITDFYKDLIKLGINNTYYVYITGGLRTILSYLLTFKIYGLIKIEKFYSVIESESDFLLLNIPSIDIINTIKTDFEKKVIKILPSGNLYKSFNSIVDSLDNGNKEEVKTKVKRVLKKLLSKKIVEKVGNRGYKLTKLGELIKIFLSSNI